MNAETQAVLFNAVPLLVIAALYFAVALARLRALGREHAVGAAAAGLAAAIVGVAILVTGEPLAGNALISLPAILLAGIPAILAIRGAPGAAADSPRAGANGRRSRPARTAAARRRR